MIKKKAARARKYFAPQNDDDKKRHCDHPGCTKCGEYRAPKDRNLKEYYWFCLDHVQEYNAKWNYYDGLEADSEEEVENRKKRFSFKNFGSKVKYNFGYDFAEFSDGLFGEKAYDFSEEDIYLNEDEKKYLRILELNISDLNSANIKKQYKKLAKKYHPDLNRDNRDAEEKFKLLSTAYNHFMKRFS